MSGPKGIQYRVDPEVARRLAEEQRLREAQTRWRQMAGAAIEISARCRTHALDHLIVDIPQDPTGDSTRIAAATNRLEQAVTAARQQLEAALEEERSRRIEHDLKDALSDLTRHEQARWASTRDIAAETVGAATNESAPAVEERRTRLAEQVARRLGRLLEPSSDLEELAATALTTPLDRAPMILDDLDARISERNAVTRRIAEESARLDTVRAQMAALDDAEAVEELLVRASTEIARQQSAAGLLDAASHLVESIAAREQSDRERRYVLMAVRESLEDLGYVTTEVEGGDPDTVVLRRAGFGAHGVRARIANNEVDLHSVGFAARFDRDADTAAERALCDDLDGVLGALERRGVTPGRIRRIPAGALPLPAVHASEAGGSTRRVGNKQTTAGRMRESER